MSLALTKLRVAVANTPVNAKASTSHWDRLHAVGQKSGATRRPSFQRVL